MSGYIKKALKQFQHQKPNNNMLLFHVRASITAPRNNTPHNNHKHHYWTRKAKNACNKYVARSYSWIEQLIPHCCVPPAQSAMPTEDTLN